MRTLIAAVAALGVAAFGVGAASAQNADPTNEDSPMYCVYTAVGGDYDLVAESYLYDDLSAADAATAKDVLGKAANTCAQTHGLTESQKEAITDIGIYGSAADYLAEELMFEGVSDEAIDGVYDVLGDLSDDDLDTIIIDADWHDDAALIGRMKTALLAVGIPDDDYVMETAMQIIEVSALATDSVMVFVLDGLDDEDDDS
jgi:hypothetical protein